MHTTKEMENNNFQRDKQKTHSKSIAKYITRK